MSHPCLSRSGWASSGLIGYVGSSRFTQVVNKHQHDPIDENEFLNKWQNAVSDTFSSRAELSLLLVRPFRVVTRPIVDRG
jgi:hypothetical protein